MDTKKSNLNPENQPINHTQQEMIQFIDQVDQLDNNQKNYLMVVLFAEGTRPLEIDQMVKLANDEFCLNWLETNTQFDYERFNATIEAMVPVDEELKKEATSTISSEQDWDSEEVQGRLKTEREEMIEHYRQVHEEEIKQSREE